MVRKPSVRVYILRKLDEFLKGLSSDDKRKKWIEDMKNDLKENMFAGKLIPKKQIPACYIRDYGVTNLYHYAHPEGYRSCYTITNIDGDPCPCILDLMTHSEYERIFGYRKR